MTSSDVATRHLSHSSLQINRPLITAVKVPKLRIAKLRLLWSGNVANSVVPLRQNRQQVLRHYISPACECGSCLWGVGGVATKCWRCMLYGNLGGIG